MEIIRYLQGERGLKEGCVREGEREIDRERERERERERKEARQGERDSERALSIDKQYLHL